MKNEYNIALTICTGEDILFFSSIINLLTKLNINHLIIDISEEKGWFRKGSQYLSLNYRRPDLSVKFDLDELDNMKSQISDFLIDNNVNINIIHGNSVGAIISSSESIKNGIVTLNLDAGIRCEGCIDYRILSDYLSNYNLTSLPSATKNLIDEGFNPSSIRLVGHPISDMVQQIEDEAVAKSSIMEELDLIREGYIASIIYDKESASSIDMLVNRSREELPVIISVSKDIENKLVSEDKYIKYMMNYDVTFIEPLDVIDMIVFLKNSKFVVSDLDHVCLISAILRKPCIYLKGNYFRPELVSGRWIKSYSGQKELITSWNVNQTALNLLGGGTVAERVVDFINIIFKSKYVPKPPKMPGNIKMKFKEWII